VTILEPGEVEQSVGSAEPVILRVTSAGLNLDCAVKLVQPNHGVEMTLASRVPRLPDGLENRSGTPRCMVVLSPRRVSRRMPLREQSEETGDLSGKPLFGLETLGR